MYKHIYIKDSKKRRKGLSLGHFTDVNLWGNIFHEVEYVCSIPARRDSIQQRSVRPDNGDVGVSNTLDAQLEENLVWGTHFFITIMNGYKNDIKRAAC